MVDPPPFHDDPDMVAPPPEADDAPAPGVPLDAWGLAGSPDGCPEGPDTPGLPSPVPDDGAVRFTVDPDPGGSPGDVPDEFLLSAQSLGDDFGGLPLDLPSFDPVDQADRGTPAADRVDRSPVAMPTEVSGPVVDDVPAVEPSRQEPAGVPAVPVGPPAPRRSQLTRRGRFLEYKIHVRQTQPAPMLDVRLSHDIPANTRFVAASPAPVRVGGRLTWDFPRLEPKTSLVFRVRVEPEAGFQSTDADGTLSYSYAVRFPVTRPRLSVGIEVPPEAEESTDLVANVVVANPGRVPLSGLTVGVTAPEAAVLRLPSRPEAVAMLPPNERVVLPVVLSFGAPGRHPLTVRVGNDVVGAEAEGVVHVVERCLRLDLEAPSRNRLGEPAVFRLRVEKAGLGSEHLVLVTQQIPDGVEWLESSGEARFDADTRSVTWLVRDLSPGRPVDLTTTLRTDVPGPLRHTATARGERSPAGPLYAEMSVVTTGEAGPTDLDRLLVGGDVQTTADDRNRLASAGRARRRGDGPGAAAGATADQFLHFSLAEIDFAIPIRAVKQIGSVPVLTPVPHAPGWVIGVANVRGDILTVLGLHTLIGLASPPVAGEAVRRFLVVRAGDDASFGTVVDRVHGLFTLAETQIRPSPVALTGRLAWYVRGVADSGRRTLLCLDLARLLRFPAAGPEPTTAHRL